VLSIFGFTGTQTVAHLCDCILKADASAALGTLHEQAEAGKDLSRLMGDLISHLRNLLVLKADPAGLEEELSSEAIQLFAEQADVVSMEKLLGLIEQFAAAEGRMKWAPNKKMHFEVAVIRANQTLQSATLTEVLATLTAIRGGTPLPAAPAPAAPEMSALQLLVGAAQIFLLGLQLPPQRGDAGAVAAADDRHSQSLRRPPQDGGRFHHPRQVG
jgi:DNA polymerase-3 subunit gamma/tau